MTEVVASSLPIRADQKWPKDLKLFAKYKTYSAKLPKGPETRSKYSAVSVKGKSWWVKVKQVANSNVPLTRAMKNKSTVAAIQRSLLEGRHSNLM